MALYNEVLPEFKKHGAELLGISVDGAWCHEAFARDRRLHFPLLADFHPKGEVATKYGAYREREGVCERALFVTDRNGVIFWNYCSPIAVNPGADGISTRWRSCQPKGKPTSRRLIISSGQPGRRSRSSNTATTNADLADWRIRSSSLSSNISAKG